jgi:hypothetical protein
VPPKPLVAISPMPLTASAVSVKAMSGTISPAFSEERPVCVCVCERKETAFGDAIRPM